MKTFLKILFFPFLWFLQSCSPLGNPVDLEVSNSHYFNRSKTDVMYSNSGNWMAQGNTAMNADVESFKVLSRYFSKDKNHIYFYDKVVNNPKVDIASFTSNSTNLMDEIGVDANNVYYIENPYNKKELKVIPDANPKSYQKLNVNWGKDNRNYFYQHKKVEVDYASFEIFNDMFSKDGERVYVYHYGDFKTLNADANTFNIFEKSNYAYDNGKVYYFYIADNELGYAVLKIPYPPNSSLEIYNSNHLRIHDLVYYKGKPIVGSDIKSFRLLDHEYAKDTAQVYFKGKIITEADVETFHIPKDDFRPSDKNGSYIGGKLKPKVVE